MSTSTVETIVQTIIDDVGDVLATGLPIVFGFLGLLIGLFFIYRVVRRKVGGPKN